MMSTASAPQGNALRRTFITALCLATMDCVATTANVDVLSHLQRERIARLGAADALAHSNAAFVRQMLVNPASPYSGLIAEPAFTNEVDWPGLLERIPGGPLTSHQALAVMQWDLGMTRARPGIDITIKAGYRDDFASASATKADVDPDIFWHVLDLTGYSHSTKGAGYAVGLQILRRQLAETPEDRRIALNVDPDVFKRIMLARHFDEVTEYDLGYVSALVQRRLVHWSVGERTSHGLRALPVAYRIARVAAAYRDLQGYEAGYPCDRAANTATGSFKATRPGTHAIEPPTPPPAPPAREWPVTTVRSVSPPQPIAPYIVGTSTSTFAKAVSCPIAIVDWHVSRISPGPFWP